MSNINRRRNKRREIQLERLKQFNQEFDHYEEKKIGEEVWVKNYDGNLNRWQVSIYSQDSFRRYKQYGENRRAFENAINKED